MRRSIVRCACGGFAMILILMCGLLCDVALAETGKHVEATLNGLTLKLDAATGSILEASYPGVGTILRSNPDDASIIDLAYPLPDFQLMRLASRFSQGAKIEKTEDCVTIRWDSLGMSRKVDGLSGDSKGVKLEFQEKTGEYLWVPVPNSAFDTGGPVAAEVRLKAAPDGKSIVMTCAVSNHSRHSIRQTLFPDFKGVLPVAGEEHSYFRGGGVNSKPYLELQRPSNGTPFWPQDAAMNGIEYIPGAYFGTMKLITQYFDFGGLKGGFSLYRRKWGWEPNDDPFTPRGSVWVRRDETSNQLRIMWANRTEIKPGEKWESAEFWLTPHEGGWARGIEPYREWARSNMNRKYTIPKHVREGLGFRTLWMSRLAFPGDPNAEGFPIWKFSDLPAQAREAKEHGLDEMVLWMWNQALQLPITPPFPQCGTEKELADAIAECNKLGVNVSLFISVYSLAHPSAEKYGIEIPKEGGWTYDPELVPAFNPYYALPLATGSANISDEKWRADVLASCKQIIDKYTASIGWDQYAGFPSKPDIYSLTDEILTMAKAKNPESTFCGESFANIEEEAAYLDYLWSWGSYGMFGDLNAYTAVFQAPRPNPNVDISPIDAKYCFINNLYMNVMPRKEGSTNGSAAIAAFPELSKALKQCAKLRKMFLPYFVDGTLIGNCILTGDAEGIHLAAYVLSDRVLILAMNTTPQTKQFTLNCDLAPWLPSASGKYTAHLFDANGEPAGSKQLAASKWTEKTKLLDSFEMTVYEVVAE
jgi:hypothetical protein